MTLEESLKNMFVARKKLASPEAVNNPTLISEHVYRLGQYTAEVEAHLGEAEKEYEIVWAANYQDFLDGETVMELTGETKHLKPLSATAAKQLADVRTAKDKGNIKELTRLVGSSWKLHTGGMARINHLTNEHIGMKGQP